MTARMFVDESFWRGRRVLLTGHTGFKGSWLSLWLQALGAELSGLSLGIPTSPSMFTDAKVGDRMTSLELDIRDPVAVREVVANVQPEVVIHMAAQSLVRPSFENPRETYETNVMGTVNVLDAVRIVGRVGAFLNVTSDKCYENREWEWAYREDEAMGGYDPYSNSKGCSELVTSAYRRSFFTADQACTRLATARAGNVIGGGDWSTDRLLPDLMRAALSGHVLRVRNPEAVRPWQHVLNPLAGYLMLIQDLWRKPEHATAWNFGPAEDDVQTVRWVVERIAERWPDRVAWESDPGPHLHEARYLKLDSSRARGRLAWYPRWDLNRGLDAVISWYDAYAGGKNMQRVTLRQIEAFTADATCW